MQEVLNRLSYDIISVPLYALISFPGSSLYLLPRVLSLPPSQGPLSASFSGPLSNSFPGASLYLLPRVLFLPPPRLLSILLSVPGSSFYLLPRVLSLPPSKVLPCIRLARRKFELTNHDSAGRKNFTVLTSM